MDLPKARAEKVNKFLTRVRGATGKAGYSAIALCDKCRLELKIITIPTIEGPNDNLL